MGRTWGVEIPLVMSDNQPCQYSLSEFEGVWFVKFRTKAGQYLRRSTRVKVDPTDPQNRNQAAVAAARVITRLYDPVSHAVNEDKRHEGQPVRPKAPASTWDTVLADLRAKMGAENNRVSTYDDYVKTLNVLRDTVRCPAGPEQITVEKAEEFKARFLSQTYTKAKARPEVKHRKGVTKAVVPKTYKRSPITLNSYIRKLRTLWNKWFRISPNPWEQVTYARTDKRHPVAPSEDVVSRFMVWIAQTYAHDLAPTFFLVKATTGCRLMDLCELRADQFDGAKIVWTPDQTKNRKWREAPLQDDVAAALSSVRGTVYLWDRYPEMIRLANQGRPGSTRIAEEFSPSNLYSWVARVLKDFKAATGHKLTSHDFRRRAVTNLYRAGYSVEKIANMIDMTIQNLLKSYLDPTASHAHLLREAGAALLPKLDS